jgi:hypothetical protein
MLVGQFSYASVGEAGPYSDVDGWKVTRVSPADRAEALRAVIDRATAPLGSFRPEPLPLLVTDEEIAALPRRLRLQPCGESTVALLHQVSAGLSHHHRDSSFAHGLLVRGAGSGPRPAALWDSPLWLRPVGEDQVSQVRLPAPTDQEALPVAGSLPPPAQLWSEHRACALLVLAVAEQAAAGVVGISRLALLDRTGAATAGWAAFLQAHLTVGAAWAQLPFSTVESPLSGPEALAGLRLAGMAVTGERELKDAATALGPEWLLIDPDRVPEPDEARGGWQFGDRFLPIGPWTQLAERLTLLEEMGLPSVTDLVDTIGALAGGSVDDAPLWALPAGLLLSRPDVLELMKQVAPDAVRLACDTWPAQLSLPAPEQGRLHAALVRYGAPAVDVFGAIARRLDQQSTASGPAVDAALDAYLPALWSGVAGARPEWAAPDRPLPWLPARSVVSAPVAGSLAARLPALLGWLGLPGHDDPDRTQRIGGAGAPDPVITVRALSGVASCFDRWQAWSSWREVPALPGALVDALAELLLTGTGCVGGSAGPGPESWPDVPRPVVDAVVDRLERILADQTERSLGAAACGWLQLRLGALDTSRPLQSWSLVDLERAAAQLRSVLPAGQPPPVAAELLGAASLLRSALRQRPGRWWPLEEWLKNLSVVLGPRPTVDAWGRMCAVLMARSVVAPLPAITDALLAQRPLGVAEHRLAQWTVLGPDVLRSASVGPHGGATVLDRLPALQVHAYVAVVPRQWIELGRDQQLRRELMVLVQYAPRLGEPVASSALSRLAWDLFALDAAGVAAGAFPWVRPPRLPDLSAWWAPTLDAVLADGDRAWLPALASSLLIRSLLAHAANEQDRPTAREHHVDPAARWLYEEAAPNQWRAEAAIKRLLEGRERAEKQQWAADTEQLAATVLETWMRRMPARSVLRSNEFRDQLVDDVRQNARELALGAFGARNPFARRGPRREDSPA